MQVLSERKVLHLRDSRHDLAILLWYRRRIAQKYDGSQNCKHPGRPKISQEIIDLVIRFKFDSILKASAVAAVKPLLRRPNLNPHAERFVRSVQEECLSLLILSSEEQLRYALGEYLKYYHHERIHQGLNRIIEPRHQGNQGEIICLERLGGLLKSRRVQILSDHKCICQLALRRPVTKALACRPLVH